MTDEEYHQCHFCGEYVNKEGFNYKGERHYLSDCRPDLVEHEIGEICTWAFRREPLTLANGHVEPAFPENRTCYAYQDDTSHNEWTDEHTHFYPDGPM